MERWRKTFHVSFIAQACSIAGLSFVLPFLPFYIQDLGITDPVEVRKWSGILGAATPLTMAVFSPLWGIVADRYGRKLMVMRSMFGGSAILLLMSFAQNVYHLLFLRMLQGAVTGTVTASTALVSSVVPDRHAGYALGMMQAAVFIGNAFGPLMGGPMAQRFGYPAAFVVAAGILAAGGALVRFFATEDFTPSPSDEGHFAPFRQVLGASGFLIALLAIFQVRFANAGAGTMFPLLVEEMLGTDKGAAGVTGVILATAGVTAAAGAGLVGRLGDRWGHKRFLVGCTLAGAVIVFPMGMLSDFRQLELLAALRAAFGFAAGGILPSANTIIRRISDERHLGKAYGVTACATAVGLGLGSLVSGYMAAYAGLAAPFFLTAGILVCTAGLVAWRIRP